MQIFFILGISLLLAALSLLVFNRRLMGVLNCCGYLAALILSVFLLLETFSRGSCGPFLDFIYLDSLSAFFILVTAVVVFASALYSIGYLRKDIEKGAISERKARIYYLFFNLFCATMFLVPALNNLGMVWVGVEMTTLVSAFLVGFYNKKESVEAAWKYIIICSVGIIFALLGTILFSYAFSISGLSKSLNWSDILPVAHILDKRVLKIAFIFILVGYGTKAGLAPMHTWLPDAHSQAVGPVSALLSGVLLKTALYAILRFGIIVIKGVGFDFFGNLMLLLGLLSLVISAGFILVQKDLKRLLAYSSIEHIGVISIGLGLGTPLAFAGALMHVFNHAAAKSLMFFSASNVVSYYHKHNLNAIRGVLRVLPFTGVMLLIGVFALTGFPPFSIFISEMMIVTASFAKGAYFVGSLFLLLLALVFAAFINHFSKMIFGNIPKGMRRTGEPLSGKLAFLFLAFLMLGSGAAFFVFKKDWIWIVQRLFPL